jgi:spore maturation protein CgeB
VFEAAGCGACQLVDWKRDLGEVLADGEEMRAWKTVDEIAGLARDILAQPGRAREMGERACRRAHGEHTYRHRMERLLHIASGGADVV